MTTLIKAKLKKSDDQLKINTYRVAANIIQAIISCKNVCKYIY